MIHFFCKAARYYLQNYSSASDWNPNGCTFGNNGINLLIIKPAISDERIKSSIRDMTNTLIHEPQHDPSQFGFGHEIKTSNNESFDRWLLEGYDELINYAKKHDNTIYHKGIITNRLEYIYDKCHCSFQKN